MWNKVDVDFKNISQPRGTISSVSVAETLSKKAS